MKKNSLLTKLTSLMLTLLILACTSDAIIEESHNTEASEMTQSKAAKSNKICSKERTIEIIIIYDFPYATLPNGQILTIDAQSQQDIKDNYRDQLSNCFTICEILPSNCDNVEKWIVIEDEYNDFNSSNPPTCGSGSNTNQSVGQIKTVSEYNGICIN